MNDRQVQAQETKNRILQTVKELLKTKSFDEIKIRDICQKAHVSVGTFYVYFTKKEEALLLVYRELDQAFDALELCGEPYENIQVILTTYYHMASIENLNYNIAIYQSHLVYYDAYFFSEERSLFRLLCGEIQKICGEGKKITWLILEMCRGNIYNFCIYQKQIPHWREQKILQTMDYLQFLINKSKNGSIPYGQEEPL